MSILTTSIDVSRSPEEVFTCVTDPSKFGEWQANVTGGHMGGSGPPQAGSRCIFHPTDRVRQAGGHL
jgi:uncharacterized protein YndB with AHSA1/START domain